MSSTIAPSEIGSGTIDCASAQSAANDASPNAETGGYDGTFTIGIDAPASGIATLEPETGGQLVLRQNSPNPFTAHTDFLFTLAESSRVDLVLYDMSGVKIADLYGGGPVGVETLAAGLSEPRDTIEDVIEP